MLLWLRKHGTKHSISHSRGLTLHRERAIWRSENFTRTRFVVCRQGKPRAVKEGLPRSVIAASVKSCASKRACTKQIEQPLGCTAVCVCMFSHCASKPEERRAFCGRPWALPTPFSRGTPVVQLSRRSLAPAAIVWKCSIVWNKLVQHLRPTRSKY